VLLAPAQQKCRSVAGSELPSERYTCCLPQSCVALIMASGTTAQLAAPSPLLAYCCSSACMGSPCSHAKSAPIASSAAPRTRATALSYCSREIL
jgi:hypothetical protein